MKNKYTLWITTTAVFVALIISVQAVTASFSQFVTGPLVNMILIVAVMTYGLPSGLTVAALSPVCAKLIGIGPLWQIVPFLMLGNAALAFAWHIIGKMKFAKKYAVRVTALAAAAAIKFLVLYLGIVRLALPFLLDLPEAQTATVAGMFSIPQLFTALAGGALAIAVLPVVEKARSSLFVK
jgi:hypothetical protein